MTSILTNISRVGNFTSSEIVKLTTNGKAKGSFGKPFYEYVDEKNFERRLRRSIGTESNSRPLTWGKLVERRVFELLPISYRLSSNDTFEHPTIKCWSGSPDCTHNENTVGDVKSPLTLKSFCQLVDPIYNGLQGMEAMNKIRETHSDGEKYYWQLVSNAILTKSTFSELIVYVPYIHELELIRSLSEELNDKRFNWVLSAEDIELPFLPADSLYRNLNVIRFEVPKEDKDFLTERVLEAEKLLIKNEPRALFNIENGG